jgi:hypothetical protein
MLLEQSEAVERVACSPANIKALFDDVNTKSDSVWVATYGG